MVYKRFTAEEKQAFATAYNGGATLKDLAAQAGVSIPTMAKYVRAGGGAVRRPGNPKNPEKGSKPGWPQVVTEQESVVTEAQIVPDAELPVRKIMSF